MVVHVSFRSLLLFLAALPTSGFIPKLYCNEPRTISWRTKLDHGRKYSTVVQRDTKRTDDTLEQFAKSEAERTDDAREESALRQKLVTESIAPWRALRLFFYGALGSGAAVGGFITLSGVAAALSGVRPDLDLNAEYINLAIDFGAALAFALLFKFDVDKGDELSDNVEAKLQKKAEGKKLAMAMEKRAKDLANLSLSIRVSADGETKKARVSVLQAGAKQHMIVVAGPKKAIRDALLGASLMKMSDFSMNNVLVVPCETGTEPKSSRGFGEKPVWEEKSYVAEPVGEGWQEFIDAEVKDAVMQSGEMAKEEGIAIVVSNTGKVLRRGVGTVPWRKMVDELNEASGGKKEQTVEIPFLTD